MRGQCVTRWMYLALEVFEDGTKLKKTIVGRANGVKECDGAEVFNSIEMVLLCMMVNGWWVPFRVCESLRSPNGSQRSGCLPGVGFLWWFLDMRYVKWRRACKCELLLTRVIWRVVWRWASVAVFEHLQASKAGGWRCSRAAWDPFVSLNTTGCVAQSSKPCCVSWRVAGPSSLRGVEAAVVLGDCRAGELFVAFVRCHDCLWPRALFVARSWWTCVDQTCLGGTLFRLKWCEGASTHVDWAFGGIEWVIVEEQETWQARVMTTNSAQRRSEEGRVMNDDCVFEGSAFGEW